MESGSGRRTRPFFSSRTLSFSRSPPDCVPRRGSSPAQILSAPLPPPSSPQEEMRAKKRGGEGGKEKEEGVRMCWEEEEEGGGYSS